jgi:hypothetical protein
MRTAVLVGVERAGRDPVRRGRRVARADEPQFVVLALRQDRQLVALEADRSTDPGLPDLDVRRTVAVGRDQSRPELERACRPVEPRARDERQRRDGPIARTRG